MAERIYAITVQAAVDSNKRTIRESFSAESFDEAVEWLREFFDSWDWNTASSSRNEATARHQ